MYINTLFALLSFTPFWVEHR